LERAILEQERWGWDVEWARWPDAYQPDKEDRPDFPDRWWQGNKRDDWERSFHDWKVIFSPPEDLAEMNSRAQEIDNSDPHELEPKGWPNRIKAIINETGYTQADLSRILEVSRAAVSQWKNGNRTPGGPHRAKLRDIERRGGLR
jgi:DNA-binding transcriptional regulator YiaG